MSDSPVEIPLTLGQQLAAARERTGLTQTGLGERYGVSRSTVFRWENDQGEPTFAQVVDLSRISGWPLQLLAQAIAADDPYGPDGQGGQSSP